MAPASHLQRSTAQWFDLDENVGVLDVCDAVRGITLSLFVLGPTAGAGPLFWWTTEDGIALFPAQIGTA